MLSSIPDILEDLRNGKMIILVDDEDRENEGDLVVAAQFITPAHINFMATHGRGLICQSMTEERIAALDLPPMTANNTSPFRTAFHVSFEAATGVTTGISAHDRARSVSVAADPKSTAADLVRPGHVFPLKARRGGVLVRTGQTEGSVDLMRIGGLHESAVICEIMNEDGTMARMPELERFSAQHGIKICSVQDIIAWRRQTETLVRRAAETKLPTEHGNFTLIVYENDLDNQEHLALVRGDLRDASSTPLVRVHSECLTGDVFHSLRCDCGKQLHKALELIDESGCGVLVYMRQEGRGIGLINKIKAYMLQDQGLDTVEANVHLGFEPDAREYGLGAQILCDLGVRQMRLLTNNPVKRTGIQGFGLDVVETVPLQVPLNSHNLDYMRTKKEKMGHLLL